MSTPGRGKAEKQVVTYTFLWHASFVLLHVVGAFRVRWGSGTAKGEVYRRRSHPSTYIRHFFWSPPPTRPPLVCLLAVAYQVTSFLTTSLLSSYNNVAPLSPFSPSENSKARSARSDASPYSTSRIGPANRPRGRRHLLVDPVSHLSPVSRSLPREETPQHLPHPHRARFLIL